MTEQEETRRQMEEWRAAAHHPRNTELRCFVRFLVAQRLQEYCVATDQKLDYVVDMALAQFLIKELHIKDIPPDENVRRELVEQISTRQIGGPPEQARAIESHTSALSEPAHQHYYHVAVWGPNAVRTCAYCGRSQRLTQVVRGFAHRWKWEDIYEQ